MWKIKKIDGYYWTCKNSKTNEEDGVFTNRAEAQKNCRYLNENFPYGF